MTRARQTVTHVPVTQLLAHPGNVRNGLGDLSELAASVREHGILQPLVVTEHPETDERFILLAGHRRLGAALLVGITQVPVVIRHGLTDCQRRDLGPVEKAEAYGALRNRGLSISEISRRTGVNTATISTLLNLLELDEASREEVRTGRIKSGDAIDAVRETRQLARRTEGRPERGRPVVAEPPHFSSRHPLAVQVARICWHTTRPKVGDTRCCGECWEAVIRAEALGQPFPEAVFDEILVQRVIDGQTTVHCTPAERVEVVRRWRELGRSLVDLEVRTGWKISRYTLPDVPDQAVAS